MMRAVATAILLALFVTAGCKKKEPEAAPAPTPVEAAPSKPAEPVAPTEPKLELSGTPSENLVAVFGATVTKLGDAKTAKEAAAVLSESLEMYDVAELREKSRAAKQAGQGASDETKQQLQSLKEQYKQLADKFSAEDPATFGASAEAWAKAWGLN